MHMKDYLKEKKPEIDKLIEKYVPRKVDESYLKWAFGEARYQYDVDAIQKTISDPIWEFLDRGGKRWRPALYLLLLEALGADLEKNKKTGDFAVVMELLHSGSLFVDDVEDDGKLRRGKRASHRIFGVDVALNAGNFLYFIPLLVFREAGKKMEPEIIKKAYEIFSREMTNIHIGQALDIHWHRNQTKITEEEYLQMCIYKTGTIPRLAARLAALFSGFGKTKELVKAVENISMSFQIQDDVLDVTKKGEERKKFGKSFGNDIKEGKKTLMVIHTLGKADEKDRKRLMEILDMHTEKQELVEEAIGIMERYNSIKYAQEKSRELAGEGWKILDKIIPDSEAKDVLLSLAAFTREREF